jgi:hypothetical protein
MIDFTIFGCLIVEKIKNVLLGNMETLTNLENLHLKALTNEKRGGLKVVAFDRSLLSNSCRDLQTN